MYFHILPFIFICCLITQLIQDGNMNLNNKSFYILFTFSWHYTKCIVCSNQKGIPSLVDKMKEMGSRHDYSLIQSALARGVVAVWCSNQRITKTVNDRQLLYRKLTTRGAPDCYDNCRFLIGLARGEFPLPTTTAAFSILKQFKSKIHDARWL